MILLYRIGSWFKSVIPFIQFSNYTEPESFGSLLSRGKHLVFFAPKGEFLKSVLGKTSKSEVGPSIMVNRILARRSVEGSEILKFFVLT